MNPNSPNWLTPIISLTDFDGDSVKYIEHVFSIFERDFILSSPIYNGKKVFYDKADDGGRPRIEILVSVN